MENVKST
jgi:sugar phosphate permease